MCIRDSVTPGQAYYYCVGTLNLGVGCSYDGKRWNIYQHLPIGLGFRDGIEQFAGNIKGITGLAIDPVNPNHILVYSRNGEIYRSLNRGVEWTVTDGAFSEEYALLSVHDQYATAIIKDYPNEEKNQLFLSTDGGAHWQLSLIHI